MSFLKSFLGAGAQQAADAATKAVVLALPETASRAMINEYEGHMNDLAARAAQALSRVEASQREVTRLDGEFQRYKTAAKSLVAQSEGNPGDASLKKDADLAVETATKLKTDLAAAKTRLDEDTSDAEQAKANHQHAAEQLQTAKAKIEEQEREQQRAEADLERQKERQRQAEKDAGLAHGLDALSAVESVRNAKLDQTKQAAAAAKLSADALTHSQPGSGGSALAAALAAADGTSKPSSLNDKLAALDD